MSSTLFGQTGWLIAEDKAGMVVQLRGIADALGLSHELKLIAPRGLNRILSPWSQVARSEKFGESGSPFGRPWPTIAIATGRASIPYIRALRRAAGTSIYTIVLQDPKTGSDTADLIWVPQHDRRRGKNVVTTLTAPHSFSQSRLTKLRAIVPDDIAALPYPRVAILLGGKNGTYRFLESDDARLKAALGSLRDLGASFMVTPSRRTHRRLKSVVDQSTRGAARIFWTGEGPNPYPHFIANADWFVVTADSVNMIGEACATGRPVYVFSPSGGSEKFARFHRDLIEYGATRALPRRLDCLDEWAYSPLDSAGTIAREIERRWRERQRILSDATAGIPGSGQAVA